jgi:hypothetical protein
VLKILLFSPKPKLKIDGKVCLQDVNQMTINTYKHIWKVARYISFIYLTIPHINLKVKGETKARTTC